MLLSTTKNNPFVDDPVIPDETCIYYAKNKAIVWLVIAVIMLCGLIWLAFTDNKSYPAVVIIGTLFLFVLFSNIRNLRAKKPWILLNSVGIQAGNLPFYEWKDIHNEEVITKIQRGPAHFLKYDSSSGTKEFFINDLDIDHIKLKMLLDVYRKRNEGHS